MSSGDPAARLPAPADSSLRASRRRGTATSGGTDGNEQLTAMTGVTLIVLLAIVGVTILRIGQLISVHLFVGYLLLAPVALKMVSTGYRFLRYYTGDRLYRDKGPPPPILRGIAPLVVLSTVVVFVSGVVLMYEGPAHRDPFLLLHKVSFIVWLAVTAVHVLGHLPGLATSFRGAATLDDEIGVGGTGGRWLVLAGALVGGLVLAVVMIPQFSTWTAAGAMVHHHHDLH